MRIVIALGGNALLQRSQPMTAEVQRSNVRVAAQAIAPLIGDHEVVIAHGNGPQVGLLALQAEAYTEVEPYPLDILGAETEGMIGYLLEQELGNVLPPEVPLAIVLTMVVVDPDDPAFSRPTKFVGPVYTREKADEVAARRGWTFREDGEQWRRVVASPLPRRIIEIRPIRWLLEHGTVVICAGGGGIPTAFDGDGRRLQGVEAVIDKDFASELLAENLAADLFVMATDVDGVYRGWGTPEAERLGWVTPDDLVPTAFPDGSMGPKVAAAVQFVQRTGRRAAIGSLADIGRIVAGEAGTSVVAAVAGATTTTDQQGRHP